MLFIPRDFILLREAIVRLAELRAPDAGVQPYLDPPPREMPEGLSGTTQVRWAMNAPPEPWQNLHHWWGVNPARPTRRPDAKEPAPVALFAAMDELRQALFAGSLRAVAKFPDGRMPLFDAQWWGSDHAEQALASGDTAMLYLRAEHWPVRATVLLREEEFVRWLGADVAPARESVRPTQPNTLSARIQQPISSGAAKAMQWMQAAVQRGDRMKREQTINACYAACKEHGGTYRNAVSAWNVAMPLGLRRPRGAPTKADRAKQ